jgi:hypothetical protein
MLISRGRIIALTLSLLVPSGAIVLSAGATTPSATSLLSTAIHNALAGGMVHEVTVTKGDGRKLMMVDDIGTDAGRQVITLSDGSSSEVIAFDSLKKAYIKGNQVGLKNYFGFPASAAKKYAGEWMEAVPSNEGWANIIGSTTLKLDFGINLRILTPVLGAKLVTIDGVQTYEISGKTTASANAPAASVHLYVSDTRTVLPVRLSEVANGVSATANWSKWGELLKLNAPSKSVPLP